MNLYVYQNGQQCGPFDQEVVVQMIQTGSVAPTDMGWHEGIQDWTPLSQILPLENRVATPLPQARTALPSPAITVAASGTVGELGRVAGIALACAVGCGLLWAVFTVYTQTRIPFIGIALGAICGKVVAWAARGQVGGVFAAIAVAASIAGIVIGRGGVMLFGYESLLGFSDLISIAVACSIAYRMTAD